MKIKYYSFRIDTFMCCVCLFLIFTSATSGFAGEQNIISAVVTDTNGVSTHVSGITSFYSAGGQWIGKKPSSSYTGLRYLQVTKEGRISVKKSNIINFSDIVAISFLISHSQPKIQKKDGTVVQFVRDNTKYSIEIADSQGKTIQKIEMNEYAFSTEKWDSYQGHAYYLRGFKGTSNTSSGDKGEFFIPLSEVKEIVFK